MFEVEKNIKIPHTSSRYPLHEMQVNDSFLVSKKDSLGKSLHHVRAAVSNYNGRHVDTKFITRTVEDGVRVWRIK